MVSFRTIATAALAAFSVPVYGAISASEMVVNIKTLTDKSQALQAPAQEITLLNAPLIIIGAGPFPELIFGFIDIATTTAGAISAMQGSDKVTITTEADAIFDAFREFVRVHQVLLNILIGKGNLIAQIPLFGAPVAAVLRQLEAVVDTVAFMIIDTVQGRSTDLTNEAGKLKGSITTAINTYSELDLIVTKLALPKLDLTKFGLISIDLAQLKIELDSFLPGAPAIDLTKITEIPKLALQLVNFKLRLADTLITEITSAVSKLVGLDLTTLNLGLSELKLTKLNISDLTKGLSGLKASLTKISIKIGGVVNIGLGNTLGNTLGGTLGGIVKRETRAERAARAIAASA